jgi:hypothetical protein
VSGVAVNLNKHIQPEQSGFDMIQRLELCAELRYLRSMRRPDLNACNRGRPVNIANNSLATHPISRVCPGNSGSSTCRQAQTRWQIS